MFNYDMWDTFHLQFLYETNQNFLNMLTISHMVVFHFSRMKFVFTIMTFVNECDIETDPRVPYREIYNNKVPKL